MNIKISFELIKSGRKVVKLKFRIVQKTPIECIISGETANDRLEEKKKMVADIIGHHFFLLQTFIFFSKLLYSFTNFYILLQTFIYVYD